MKKTRQFDVEDRIQQAMREIRDNYPHTSFSGREFGNVPLLAYGPLRRLANAVRRSAVARRKKRRVG